MEVITTIQQSNRWRWISSSILPILKICQFVPFQFSFSLWRPLPANLLLCHIAHTALYWPNWPGSSPLSHLTQKALNSRFSVWGIFQKPRLIIKAGIAANDPESESDHRSRRPQSPQLFIASPTWSLGGNARFAAASYSAFHHFLIILPPPHQRGLSREFKLEWHPNCVKLLICGKQQWRRRCHKQPKHQSGAETALSVHSSQLPRRGC